MSRIYSIDFNRLVVALLPTMLRKPGLFALTSCLVKPLVTLYGMFMQQRKSDLYEASVTPQVCSLRGLLNDAFDSELRRIKIADGQVNDWTFVYSQTMFNFTEGKLPLWLSSGQHQLISKQGVISSIGFDFAVLVPTELRNNNNHNRLTSLVDAHKLASKRYIVNYY